MRGLILCSLPNRYSNNTQARVRDHEIMVPVEADVPTLLKTVPESIPDGNTVNPIRYLLAVSRNKTDFVTAPLLEQCVIDDEAVKVWETYIPLNVVVTVTNEDSIIFQSLTISLPLGSDGWSRLKIKIILPDEMSKGLSLELKKRSLWKIVCLSLFVIMRSAQEH